MARADAPGAEPATFRLTSLGPIQALYSTFPWELSNSSLIFLGTIPGSSRSLTSTSTNLRDCLSTTNTSTGPNAHTRLTGPSLVRPLQSIFPIARNGPIDFSRTACRTLARCCITQRCRPFFDTFRRHTAGFSVRF